MQSLLRIQQRKWSGSPAALVALFRGSSDCSLVPCRSMTKELSLSSSLVFFFLIFIIALECLSVRDDGGVRIKTRSSVARNKMRALVSDR